mgnify:CR=1
MHFLRKKMRNGIEPFPTYYRISPDTAVTVPASCPMGTMLIVYSSFSNNIDSFLIFLFLDIIL